MIFPPDSNHCVDVGQPVTTHSVPLNSCLPDTQVLFNTIIDISQDIADTDKGDTEKNLET